MLTRRGAVQETATTRVADASLQHERSVHGTMLEAAVDGDLERIAELAYDACGGTVAILVPGVAATQAPAPPGPADPIPPGITRLAAALVRGRPVAVPVGLRCEAAVLWRGAPVGLVGLLDGPEPIAEGAAVVIEQAATATMVAIATDDLRRQAELALHGGVIEALRGDAELDLADLVRRAARRGCDLSSGGSVIVAEAATPGGRSATAATISEAHPTALVERFAERVYALIPGGGPCPQLLARLDAHGAVGHSSVYSSPDQLRWAVREADLTLETLSDHDPCLSGTYRLLLRFLASQPDGLHSFYESSLGPLRKHDEIYQTQLTATLASYLASNCNVNETARAMFAHRHTVTHRLERIHELTGIDPTDYEGRERLGLALKVGRLVDRPARRS